jgi:hypothetical protein
MLKQKAETLTDSEVAEVLEYISIMNLHRQQTKSSDPLVEAMLNLMARASRGGPGKNSISAAAE